MRQHTGLLAALTARLWIFAAALAVILAGGLVYLAKSSRAETAYLFTVLPTPDTARESFGIRHERVPAPDSHHAAAANLADAPAEMGPATWSETDENAGPGGAVTNTAGLTAAHPTLPIGTRALVENVKNGQFIVVRIDGRLPPTCPSIIDLSKQAAERLDMIADGMATVRVRRVAEPIALTDTGHF
jgi:rare lipoprotein A